MSEPAHEKFGFDTVFDNAGEVAFAQARPKRLFPAEEVEAVRAQAMAEGERRAMASIAAQQAQALASIADSARLALSKLAEVAHDHRQGSAELALACARAIADASLELFPQAVIRQALESLAREIEAAPRLMVSTRPELVEPLTEALNQTAELIGYSGQIQVRANPGMPPAAFTLDFGDGSASYDPQAATQRVTAALDAALAAEGLHAEPLIPGV